VDDARFLLSKLDSRLGKPLPERSYAEDCALYTPYDEQSSFRNLRDTIWDEFILAHFFGWFEAEKKKGEKAVLKWT
jgi:phosphatidylserine synthase 2